MKRQGLVQDKESKETTSWVTEFIQTLGNGLRQGSRSLAPIRVKTWSKDINYLLGKYSKEELTSVLQWLLKNLDQEHVPKVYSAKTFKEKFPRLLDLMNKSGQLPLSEDAEFVLRQITTSFNWTISQLDLQAAVQLCLNSYTPWYEKFLVAKLDKPNKRLAVAMVNDLLPPRHFVFLWMMQVYLDIKYWDGWNGSLTSMTCDPASKRFQTWGRRQAVRFCADASRWDKLMEAVK